ANRHPEGEYTPLDSEIYAVSLSDGRIRALTDRRGPDTSPAVSPDGKHIAYVGFDDRQQGHQVMRLYVMDSSGKNSRVLTDKLDRSVRSPIWRSDNKGVYFLFDDEGNTKVGYVSLDKEWTTVAGNVGGTTLGRPYASGSFSLGGGKIAFTQTRPGHPADVAVADPAARTPHRLTRLNDGLFSQRALAESEEIWYSSSHDGRKIQGWILK